jgi:hypothetical protein
VEQLMKALSIRQPWAWLIVRPDLADPIERARELAAGRIKTIENRTWATRHRGPTLIHAAQSMSKLEYLDVLRFIDQRPALRPILRSIPDREAIQRGGIVGVASVIDSLAASPSPWFMGAKGHVLADARPLPFVQLKGALGYFNVPEDVARSLEVA